MPKNTSRTVDCAVAFHPGTDRDPWLFRPIDGTGDTIVQRWRHRYYLELADGVNDTSGCRLQSTCESSTRPPHELIRLHWPIPLSDRSGIYPASGLPTLVCGTPYPVAVPQLPCQILSTGANKGGGRDRVSTRRNVAMPHKGGGRSQLQ